MITYTLGVGVCAALLYSAGILTGSAAAQNAADEEYDEDTYGPKELMVWNEPVPRVTFSHKVHTMDVGLSCEDCHDDIFEMEMGSAVAKGDFTMASFAKGNYCGACHDGDTAFDAMSGKNCTQCHTPPKSVVFTKPVKAVVFEHQMHVDEYGLGCEDCHSGIFKMHIGEAEKNPDQFTMEALYKGEYCGACHDGDTAFASDTKCTTCHIGVMGFDRMIGTGHNVPEGHH